VVDRSCCQSAAGIHLYQRTGHGFHLFCCSWPFWKSYHRRAGLDIPINHGIYVSWTHHGVPWIASSSTMCNFVYHFSSHSIAHNLIFTAHSLSPTFPNFLFSLQQMEPMPSHMRNPYSHMNHEAHLERALAFKIAANASCPSTVGLPNVCLDESYCGRLMSTISVLKEYDVTDQEISDDKSQVTGESTLSFDIEHDHFNHYQVVLHLGQVRQYKSLCTLRVLLPKEQSCARTVITCPLLSNSRNPPGAMAPPMHEQQKSTLRNISSGSDRAWCLQALLQHKARGDYIVAQLYKANVQIAKRFMAVRGFAWNPWPFISNLKFSAVEQAWKLAIDAQHCQQA